MVRVPQNARCGAGQMLMSIAECSRLRKHSVDRCSPGAPGDRAASDCLTEKCPAGNLCAVVLDGELAVPCTRNPL
jgi:hypothetical protein